jgi:hypothetical protein
MRNFLNISLRQCDLVTLSKLTAATGNAHLVGTQTSARGLSDGTHNAHNLTQSIPVHVETLNKFNDLCVNVEIFGSSGVLGNSHFSISFII